jgi:hypothetical protein
MFDGMENDALEPHVASLLRSRARASEVSRRTERTRVPIKKDWQEFQPNADWRVARDKELLERLRAVAGQFSEQAGL